jgi:prophage regulatory protein
MEAMLPATIVRVNADEASSVDAPILDRLLTLHEVKLLTSLSKTSIYRKVAAGTFPPPVPISEHRVAWSAFEIQAWRMRCRDSRAAPVEVRAA